MSRSGPTKRPAAAVRTWHGAAAAVLTAGDCEAVVLPSLGMLVASFTHRGDELVALPGGLGAYRAGHTTGIPLLYPWANRLARDRYREGNLEIDLRGLDLHTDDNGLPIHGLMLARPEWEVTRLGAGSAQRPACRPLRLRRARRPHGGVPVPARARGGRDARGVGPADRHHGAPERPGERPGRVRLAPVPAAPRRHPGAVGAGASRVRTRRARRARHPHRAGPARRGRRAPLAGRDLDDLFALGRERIITLTAPERRLTVTYDDGYPVRAGVRAGREARSARSSR